MDWRFRCYDIGDDRGVLLRAICPDPAHLPPFVKTAQFPPSGLDTSWALVYDDPGFSLRKFATGDRGNVWLSALYMARTGQYLPEPLRKTAANRLLHSCEGFGIQPHAVLEKLAWGEAVAAKAPDEFTKYAAEVESAREAKVLAGIRREPDPAGMDPASRHAFYKTAHAGYGNAIDEGSLQAGMMVRLLHLPEQDRPGVIEALTKLAFDPLSLVGFVRDFDLRTGLVGGWGSALPDPYTTVFGVPGTRDKPAFEKVAARVWHLGSVVTTADDIRKLASSPTFAESFPPSFVSQFREAPIEIFDSLPMDTKQTLAKLARSCR